MNAAADGRLPRIPLSNDIEEKIMRRIFKHFTGGRFSLLMTLLAVCLVMTTTLLMASAACAGEYWKQTYGRFSGTAGETLAVGDVVCIKASDGEIYLADADDSSLRPAVGVIRKGGVSGDTVEVVVSGILAGQTAASPGGRLFLSTSAGEIATSGAGTADQVIGWVLPGSTAGTSTSYWIQPVPPIVSTGANY